MWIVLQNVERVILFLQMEKGLALEEYHLLGYIE